MSTLPTIEKNEVFELAFRFITETAENIFLTGKAGTGKTTFLKYLKDHCTKNIVVAAPTGVAAINAGGVTLHSLFQLPFHPFLPTKSHRDELLGKIRYNRQRQQLLRKMELLVIDEISMVRCDVMDAIDTILRSVRRNFDTPFGGVQLLCIGDLHQLPPVAQNHEWAILQEYYASPFFFDSMAVKEQTPLLIELNKIYRQKQESFVNLLNKVRNNNMDADDFEDLHQRYIPGFVPYSDEKYITLTSHNKQAELINNSEIQQLHTAPFVFAAEIENDFAEHLYPADAQLMLKEGAQVMFLKNDPVQKRYFNGKIGVVRTLEKEKIIVDCDGDLIEVFRETWENSRYTLSRADGKLEQEVLGTFSQYPLRLAWAITIHKSQGLTFEKVMIDAGAAFSSGQVYVALSRCTSLDGIVLLSKIPASAILSNDNVIKGQQSLTHKGSLADRFAGARQVFTQQLLEEIFSFHQAADAVHVLKFHIDMQAEKLSADAKEWIADLQQKLNAEIITGAKFIRHIYTMMKDEPVIENNIALQERISAAANHFIPNITAMLETVKNQPLVTEHKEAAEIVNEHLMNAALALHSSNYYLGYCKTPFSVTTFLQHKLNFAQPRLNITCYASGKKQVYTDVANQELYDTLKRWRDLIVSETGQPIFMVVSHAGLKDIATFLPKTKRDLLLISGFGKAKVDKYGDDIIEAVQDYCERHHLSGSAMLIPVHSKKERKTKTASAEIKEPKVPSREITFNLFKAGKNIEEVAKERGLAGSTVESHLSSYLQSGELKIEDFMTTEKYEQIMAVIKDRGEVSLTDLKPQLPADITFGDLRMAEAAYKFKEGIKAEATD
jgi:hypothetical protein